MKLSTIVVGVDERDPSTVAVDQAIALAKHHNGHLVLVHASAVSDTTLYAYEEGTRGNAPWKVYFDELMSRANDMLEQRAQLGRDQGLRVTTKLVHRFPDAAIVSTAKEVGADLVVVGSHGRRGPESWLLGSVAQRVVRLAPCSVLVARRGTTPKGSPDKLIVATDFSATAELALTAGLALANRDAAVEVLHCWDSPLAYGVSMPAELGHAALSQAQQQLKQFAAKHHADDKRVTVHLVSDQAVAGIAQRVEEQQPDWLVIGSHGRRGLRRLILGSVAEQTLRRVTRSVLVVRATEPK